MQERLSKFRNLHSLRISRHFGLRRISSHALAQCPVLWVVELSINLLLYSPGTFEEAVDRLEDSNLQLLKIHTTGSSEILSAARIPSNLTLHVVLLAFIACRDASYVAEMISSPLITQISSGQVWMVHKPKVTGADVLDSVRLKRSFSCTLEDSKAGAGHIVLVLQRRCAKDAI